MKIELPPNLPVAQGDERRLTQVLLNLVGNAIKFTDTGEVAIKAATSNGSYTVSVRDTGPGIDKANQSKIFEEFQQADNSATKKKGGTGLGLAIAKRIVEMHGGQHLGRIQTGRGRHVLLLGAAAGRATGAARMNKRILVVEDQEDNRQILRDLLGNAGYEMIEAEDGEQALAQAAKRPAGPDPDGYPAAADGRLRGDAPPQGRSGTEDDSGHRRHVVCLERR